MNNVSSYIKTYVSYFCKLNNLKYIMVYTVIL